MALRKGAKIDRGYATVTDDCDNYREISEVMTEMGWAMNHSSARNYVLRAMRKFARAFAEHADVPLSQDAENEMALSPSFQTMVGELLSNIEINRREEKARDEVRP